MRPPDHEKWTTLLTKVMELVVADGIDAFSLHKLARVSGMSAGNIYTYFTDKEDLFRRCYGTAEADAASAALRQFRPDMGLKEGLWRQWDNRYRYIRLNTVAFRFTEQLRNNPFIKEWVRESSSLKSVMTDFVTQCVKKKELADLPEEVFWSLAYGPFYALVNFHLNRSNMAGTPFALPPAVLRQTFDRVLISLQCSN